jgi:hypothetical protein
MDMKDISRLIKGLSVLFLVGVVGLAGCGKKDDGKKNTIKSPAGDVRIEKKSDDSITVKDAMGNVEISAKTGIVPSELNVKIYPNAQVDKSQGSMKVEVPQGILVTGFFITNDKPAAVMTFYAKEIKSSYTANTPNGGTIIGKTSQGDDVTINVKEQGEGTKIYMQEMRPKKKQ